MNDRVYIDGNSLTIVDVVNVSSKNYIVEFSNDKKFLDKLKNSRLFLEEYIRKGYPVYGVTTGFGDSCHNQINSNKGDELQQSLVRFHGIGLGDALSEELAKAVILVRLNSHLKGYSATTLQLSELMKEFINRQIIPVIPVLGSVGASGDLTPLSYLAATLMGERKVYYRGKIVETKEALTSEGLTAISLRAKEGLALMNGTSVMTAIASYAWFHIDRLAKISDFITAATVGIIKGNDIPFRSKVSEIKNHTGQCESANYIYSIIKDSKIVTKYENLLDSIGSIEDNNYKKHTIKIQDRYSVRCAPQINGVLRDTLIFTKLWIENELNSSNDNPLVDAEKEIIYNSGNFMGEHISAACDYLRIALANTADLADKQSALIIDGKFNKLTENLIPYLDNGSPLKGLCHGFKAAQITISALSSEIHFLASPVSIHSRPTEALNQDIVSLGTISSRKLYEMVSLVYLQFSVHILAILQAMDLIGPDKFSSFTQKVYNELRGFTNMVREDRPLDEEANKVAHFLRNTNLFDTIG